MNNNFYSGMKTMDIIDQLKPKTILEIGFGAGMNVLLLLCYLKKPGNDYRLISVSDSPKMPELTLPYDCLDQFIYIYGVSYRILPNWFSMDIPEPFKKPIDFCIIDSDHNYYTLKQELNYIDSIMSPTCAIALHDTASKPCKHHMYFANALNQNSNSMISNHGYLDKTEYPRDKVIETFDVPLMQAIDEFLVEHKDYNKILHIDECCGCTLIGRNFSYDHERTR